MFGDKDCRLAPFNFGGWDNAVRLVDKGVEILRRRYFFSFSFLVGFLESLEKWTGSPSDDTSYARTPY